MAAFVTTCCIMLFITALQGTIGREFTREEISIATKITMVNVVLISIVMAVIDYLRRKFTVDGRGGDFHRHQCASLWLVLQRAEAFCPVYPGKQAYTPCDP